MNKNHGQMSDNFAGLILALDQKFDKLYSAYTASSRPAKSTEQDDGRPRPVHHDTRLTTLPTSEAAAPLASSSATIPPRKPNYQRKALLTRPQRKPKQARHQIACRPKAYRTSTKTKKDLSEPDDCQRRPIPGAYVEETSLVDENVSSKALSQGDSPSCTNVDEVEEAAKFVSNVLLAMCVLSLTASCRHPSIQRLLNGMLSASREDPLYAALLACLVAAIA